jgi:hypothetical protein
MDQSQTPSIEQLNWCNDLGLVSDLCLTWADVAEPDLTRALSYLESVRIRKQTELNL